MAAVRGFDWTDEEKDRKTAWDLARALANVERAYLPRVYTTEVLEALRPLPPLHRMGLCCANAFEALDAGDAVGAVCALREGLESCPEMKPMTEFLLDEVQRREQKKQSRTPRLS